MDRYHRDHSSGGEDGLEEMDETEETEFLADTGLGDTTQKVSQEEANWRDKPVDDKCEEMMEQLATGRRRWKDGQGENPGIPALEDFKIKSLDERDPRNEHRPTFLHALATRWKEYKTQHVAVRQAILYIIQNAPIETARKGRYGEAPIWHEAASYGNMDFLNFIKENFRDRLLPILMMPDALGRNFFHDIFLAPVSTSSDKEPTRKRTLIRANQYLAIASQESLAAQDDLGNTPVHYAMHSAQCRGRGEEYIKHVKNMILRADSLMKHGTDFNNFDQSPYQFCVQSKTTKRKTAAGQSFTSGREKSDKTTKMSFLDVAKSKVIEINLYFDAAGQKSKSARAVAELVDRLAIGGFDKTLSYVHIPILVNEDAEETPPMGPKRYTSRHTTSSTTAVPRNPRLGRRSLVSVFDKLYYAGVRQILYLDVEDKAAPHTDEAIERALAGYDWLGPTKSSRGERITVETWNWRKIDLSIDVICHAAPEVRHLHLYWSGNQAVLRGWASKDGIPRLCSRTRGKGLQTVDIHATPGLESVERMRRSLNIFKNSLKQNIELEEMPEIYQHESINNPLNPPTAGPHEHSTTRNQGL
ncbi:hypothetical protein N8T08_000439 [Aspergillus melleus]|uniref:Uncharacterized protein n=1 Tax=Aspergillus melleus TaxID=138277 RepID=A0ACC3BB77_9EURO|nr:hypothetical protein N8T08_000439 [Aspergillus melleus]